MHPDSFGTRVRCLQKTRTQLNARAKWVFQGPQNSRFSVCQLIYLKGKFSVKMSWDDLVKVWRWVTSSLGPAWKWVPVSNLVLIPRLFQCCAYMRHIPTLMCLMKLPHSLSGAGQYSGKEQEFSTKSMRDRGFVLWCFLFSNENNVWVNNININIL